MRLKMFDPLSIELRDNMIFISKYKPTQSHDCSCEYCDREEETCPHCDYGLLYKDQDHTTKIFNCSECKKESIPWYIIGRLKIRNKEIISLLEQS